MPPRDNEATQPSQSVSAWYGKVKPRVCTPNPTPQVLQQQVMYKPRQQKQQNSRHLPRRHRKMTWSVTRFYNAKIHTIPR